MSTGLYVASNATSLGAQINLQRNTAQLQEIITRLSTGLRINSGKDDPSGLMASELLKSDITATKQAIQNTTRANSVIAIADSALGQISALLNDIRGLINASANTGVMTDDQIAANQLQLDASLESIDRIAKTTNYQGQNLLDGSFDFTTQGVNRNVIESLDIHSANFGTEPAVDVTIDVLEEAKTAKLIYSLSALAENTVLEIGGNYGKNVFSFDAGASVESMAKAINAMSDSTGVIANVGAEATQGQILLTSAGVNNDINLTTLMAGTRASDYAIKFTAGSSEGTAVVITEPGAGQTGVIDFQLQMEPWANAAGSVDESQIGVYTTSFPVGGMYGISINTASGRQVNVLNFIAATNNPINAGKPDLVAVDLDSSGVMNIEWGPGATYAEVIAAINRSYPEFTATTNAPNINSVTETGKVFGSDSRTSNSINLTANAAGTALNNTDVVYVNNTTAPGANSDPVTAQEASTTIQTGSSGQNLTITADENGSQYNGITFEFIDGTETGISAKQTGNTITIDLGTGDVAGATVTAINDALKLAGLKYTVSEASNGLSQLQLTHTITLGTHNDAVQSPAQGGVVRGTYGVSASEAPVTVWRDADGLVTAVQDMVSYNEQAQRASTTIYDGANYLTFISGIASSEFNGTNIKIEQDDNYTNGKIAVAYNRESGMLQITGDLANATYSNLIDSVLRATDGAILMSLSSDPNGISKNVAGSTKMTALADQTSAAAFNFTLGTLNTTMNTAVAPAAAGTPTIAVVGGKVGTDHGSIIVNVEQGVTTAQMVVNAINGDAVVGKLVTASNSVDSDGQGAIFLAGDDNESIRFFSSVLQGGSSGTNTVVTAKELIDFINSNETLSEMFHAQLAVGNDGSGLLSLFQEVAYYGDEIMETALQFLGPAGSPNIEFLAGPGFKNQELSVAFVDDPATNPSDSLAATNIDAALSITATIPGLQYNDVAVRFVRLDSNFTSADNYATYESGPSAAFAYCDINSTNNNTNSEIGNFILTATNKGDTYNDVEIMVQVDSAQSDSALASFDPNSKRLIISVNSIHVKLDQAMAAIEREGTFTADFDYSYNANPYSDPGVCDFSQLLDTASERSPISIGNTGGTGGHKGGVLTVYLGGDDDEITAQAVVDAINNSVQTKNLFNASNYPGSDGTGIIDIRGDSLMQKEGECGAAVSDYKMVLKNTASECADPSTSTMVVYLATDQDGNSITTAQDLVDYFNSLLPEETRGISVSLIKPPGYSNVPDDWCVEEAGRGLLQPTGYYDECDVYVSTPIEFVSANTEDKETYPSGRIVAVNGDGASLDIYAKEPGTAYEGVTIRYQNLTDPNAETSVDYDSANKIITVNIREGITTAAQVKALLESSEATKGLFRAELVDGTGALLVTTSDNALSLSGGTYTSGTPGGASILGATDDEPNKLVLESMYEGSSQKVTVRVIKGGFEVKDENGQITEEAKGTDMKAQGNGIDMISDGRTLRLKTSMIDMTVTMASGTQAGDSTSFIITGGGATFQLGPDVVTSQQIRISIPSVNTTRLGGLSGYLYQLKSGEDAALDKDTKLADRIVQEAINSITTLRGRLGALQKCTLEPNLATLEDTVEQMVSAEADISNADFAEESSRLTRAQLLVQSGAQVLGIANQLPQYASMLIGQ